MAITDSVGVLKRMQQDHGVLWTIGSKRFSSCSCSVLSLPPTNRQTDRDAEAYKQEEAKNHGRSWQWGGVQRPKNLSDLLNFHKYDEKVLKQQVLFLPQIAVVYCVSHAEKYFGHVGPT